MGWGRGARSFELERGGGRGKRGAAARAQKKGRESVFPPPRPYPVSASVCHSAGHSGAPGGEAASEPAAGRGPGREGAASGPGRGVRGGCRREPGLPAARSAPGSLRERPVWQGLPGKWWAFGRRGRQGGGGGREPDAAGPGAAGPSVSGGCGMGPGRGRGRYWNSGAGSQSRRRGLSQPLPFSSPLHHRA